MKRFATNIFFILTITAGVFAQDDDFEWMEPRNISILNSNEDDFAPAWNKYENRLYFNSTRSGYSYFYVSKMQDSAVFSEADLLKSPLNKANSNQSYIAFFSAQTAYISEYNLSPKRSYMNIFEVLNVDKNWTKPYVIDNLAGEYFASHITVSPDGSVLVFSSDKNNEAHNLDLWIAYRQDNGTWGGLTSIFELNTSGNEITPFLASGDTLYFSSNGLGGQGGYDIFMSVRRNGVWQKPYPITDLNTQYDETDFTMLPNNYYIFSSNNPAGKGKMDLYLTAKIKHKITYTDLLTDVEVGIAVQTNTIKVLNDKNYHIYPVIPYVFNNFDINKQYRSVLSSHFNIFPSIDSIALYSIDVIGHRLRNKPEADLKLSVISYSDQQVAFAMNQAEALKNYLKKNFEINHDRIKILTEKPVNPSLDSINTNIHLSSNSPDIFDPLELGTINSKVEPSSIDIQVYARPASMIKDWECSIYINGQKSSLNKRGKKLPEEFTIDFQPYIHKIMQSDSVEFEIVATDTLKRSYSQRVRLDITHYETKSKEIIRVGGKNYEQFYVVFNNDMNSNDLLPFNELIARILDDAQNDNTIRLSYFSKSTESARKNAELFADILNKGIKDKKIKIKTDFDSNLKIGAGSYLIPYILRILIEKD